MHRAPLHVTSCCIGKVKRTQICHPHNFFLGPHFLFQVDATPSYFPLMCFFLCQLFTMVIMVMLVLLIAMFHVAQGRTRM